MVCALLFAISAFAMAATSTSSTYAGAGSNNDDRWRRVELSSGQVSPGAISQITVAIETRGPRLSGRIRIPGGIASNFETAGGRAVVDLINVEVHGYRNDQVLVSGPPAGELVVTAGVQKMAPGLRVALPGAKPSAAVVSQAK